MALETKKEIFILLKGYPRLSETFIAQEIYALEQAGVDITLVSMRKPTDEKLHSIHKKIKAEVIYLPEYLHHQPLRVGKAFFKQILKNGKAVVNTFKLFIKLLSIEFSRNTFRRFGQAMVLSNECGHKISHLHVHFLHTPASVGLLTSNLLGIDWSVSAHAKDIWTQGADEIKIKLASMSWLTTCTRTGYEYLASLADDPNKVELNYHGIDLTRFHKPLKRRFTYNSRKGIRILSVGRAVSKKGFDDLLMALHIIKQKNIGRKWHWTHIGGGELLSGLKKRAKELDIEENITWLGPQSQSEVLQAYRASDIFVLPCKRNADGDMDGLPNVILEAQSQMLPCISTSLPGVKEGILHEKTGLLVSPENPGELAEKIESLISNDDFREDIAEAASQSVFKNFDFFDQFEPLKEKFIDIQEQKNGS